MRRGWPRARPATGHEPAADPAFAENLCTAPGIRYCSSLSTDAASRSRSSSLAQARELHPPCGSFCLPHPIRIMASRRPALQEDVSLRTLRLLADNPRISQRDLAARVGISVGAAHYCLAALAEKGLIKLANFHASPNKRGYAYLLTPEGMAAKAALTVSFLRRKLAEYDVLKAEIAELEREAAEAPIMAEPPGERHG